MKKILGNLKNVDVKTATRGILLLVGLVNLVFNLLGIKTLPFTDEQISSFVAGAYILITSTVGYYFNNNFTPEAQKAQVKLEEYKARDAHAQQHGAALDQQALQESHEIPQDYYEGNI